MIEISIEEINKNVVIKLSGEITMSTIIDIELSCQKYINAEIDVLALDLKYVRFIDSFGISRIIKQSKAFHAKKTDFVLINMNDDIDQIFKIATLDKLFIIMTQNEFNTTYIQP